MRAARQETRPEVELMTFAPIDTRAPNPEAWPVDPFLWFQPELAISAPPPSALRPSRRNEPAPPTFAPLLAIAPGRPTPVLCSRHAVNRAKPGSQAPASDLTPLGWDPRAVQ